MSSEAEYCPKVIRYDSPEAGELASLVERLNRWHWETTNQWSDEYKPKRAWEKQVSEAMKKWGDASDEAASQLGAVAAERDALAKALEKAQNDTARLDYLDSLNASLNARHGTKYGWAMVVNQNVNRVMFNFPRGVDLSDYNPHGFGSCRGAIDQRMAETAAYRRLALKTQEPDK